MQRAKVSEQAYGWIAAFSILSFMWAIVLAVCVLLLRTFVGTHTSWWLALAPMIAGAAFGVVLLFLDPRARTTGW